VVLPLPLLLLPASTLPRVLRETVEVAALRVPAAAAAGIAAAAAAA